jgi:hypothetical protein
MSVKTTATITDAVSGETDEVTTALEVTTITTVANSLGLDGTMGVIWVPAD